MKISKKDALQWFEFFSMLPEDEDSYDKTTRNHILYLCTN